MWFSMLFHSNDFLVFFALVSGAYFAAQGRLFLRNLVVVVAATAAHQGQTRDEP